MTIYLMSCKKLTICYSYGPDWLNVMLNNHKATTFLVSKYPEVNIKNKGYNRCPKNYQEGLKNVNK